MNLKVQIIANFKRDENDLEALIADLGQVLIDWGLGNHIDGDVDSLVVVNNFNLESEDDYEEWLQEQVDEGAFVALPVAEGD